MVFFATFVNMEFVHNEKKIWDLDWKPWVQCFLFFCLLCIHLGRIISQEMLLEKSISLRLSELVVCLNRADWRFVFIYFFQRCNSFLGSSYSQSSTLLQAKMCSWLEAVQSGVNFFFQIFFEPLKWKCHTGGVFIGITASQESGKLQSAVCLAWRCWTPNFFTTLKLQDAMIQFKFLTWQTCIWWLWQHRSKFFFFDCIADNKHRLLPNSITASIKWQLP